MPSENVVISSATEIQLRRFLEETLGQAEPPAGTPLSKLRAMVTRVWDKKEFPLEIQAEPPVQPPTDIIRRAPPEQKAGAGKNPDPMVTVTISEVDEPGGQDPVFLGVNGRGIYVERAKQQVIKYRYYLRLAEAIKVVWHQAKLNDDLIPRYVPLYPHVVNKMPAQEAIDAWVQRDADLSNANSLRKLAIRNARIGITAAAEAAAEE